ncbi:MAG: formyltetrahydrofolate deformylase [Alphaproteobacteria bacterium]
MFILRVKCEDRAGIVAAVSTCLSNAECNIEESAQFNDQNSGQFFMRVMFSPITDVAKENFCSNFEKVACGFDMHWDVHDCSDKVRSIIMVSKEDHCLHEILYRWASGNMAIDIAGVVSNHETCRKLVEGHGLPFYYLPTTPDTKEEQEQALRGIIADTGSDLIVLARYMQILSEEFSHDYAGQVINIHHSFLPGFKGARPYDQAYARGVKLIGATAHFATSDLDEGPIIEQETVRISHADDVRKLREIGRDTEKLVLARSINIYTQRRIFLNGSRTVIL